MPVYPYSCKSSHYVEIEKPVSLASRKETCYCGEELTRIYTPVNLTNTRDGFGIKRGFRDKQTGKYIDTWGKWERAGFEDPAKSEYIPHDVKQRIKQKKEMIKFYKDRNVDPTGKAVVKE